MSSARREVCKVRSPRKMKKSIGPGGPEPPGSRPPLAEALVEERLDLGLHPWPPEEGAQVGKERPQQPHGTADEELEDAWRIEGNRGFFPPIGPSSPTRAAHPSGTDMPASAGDE